MTKRTLLIVAALVLLLGGGALYYWTVARAVGRTRLPLAHLMASRILSDMLLAGPGGFHIFHMMRGGSTPNPKRTVQAPTEVKLTEKARAVPECTEGFSVL